MPRDLLDTLFHDLIAAGLPEAIANRLVANLRLKFGGSQAYIRRATPWDEVWSLPPDHPIRLAIARGDAKAVARGLKISIFQAKRIIEALQEVQDRP